MKVLLAGVERVGDELAERLAGLVVESFDPDDPEAPDRLAGAAAAVLSLAAYEGLISREVALDLPLVVCLDPATPTDLLRRLTRAGVQRLMFEPVEGTELAREIQRVTGAEARTTPRGGDTRRADGAVTGGAVTDGPLASEIAALWDEFRGTMIARLEVLEEVGTRLFEGDRDPEALAEARTAAHKLHGSLGTFGLDRASELAADVEGIVERGAATEGQVFRYAELVVDLRTELETADVAAAPAAPDAPDPPSAPDAPSGSPPDADAGRVTILVLEPDAARAEGVVAAGLARGWRTRVVASLDGVIDALQSGRPDLLILDPAAADGERLEAILRRIALYPPRLPTIFWSDQADLSARVSAAALGVDGFVERQRNPAVLIDQAAALLRSASRTPATVLVVDDDRALLALTGRSLNDETIRVVAISDPLLFWDALEATCPDLLLLDIDMPHINGIQLCRVVRASSRWAHLPIMFLTAHADRETITRAMRAGADDYVIKPLPGSELRARVESRLDRLRVRRGLPGLPHADLGLSPQARASAADRAGMALTLARRHGEPVALAVVRVRPGAHDDVRVSLSRVAGAIRQAVRPEDVLARWSPTELLVGLYGMTAEDAAHWLASKIERTAEDEPIADVGVAGFPRDGADLGTLIDLAGSVRIGPDGGEGAAEAAVEGAVERTGGEAAERAGGGAAEGGGAKGGAKGGTKGDADGEGRLDVVLVEDDEALAALLTQTLGARGYTTRWIADGVEAARLLAGESPKLAGRVILLDIGLPGLDGLSVLRRLARSGVTGRSRVVMLTARTVEADVLRSLELGAFDHVPKPFSVAELLLRVRRAMETGDRPA